MKFEEVNLIIEGVSKSQKEAGQRAMATQAYQLKNQLISWFNDRWSAKNAHNAGLTLDKKKIEKERLDRILEKIELHQERAEDSFNDNYYTALRTKELTGAPVQWRTHEAARRKSGAVTYPRISEMPDQQREWFKMSDPENSINVYLDTLYGDEDTKSEKIEGKFFILHEYKHLLDMFKQIIVSGKCKGVDTYSEIKKGHIKKIQKVEGRANAHALDNIYRKDRLSYLVNTSDGKKILNTKVKKVPKKVSNVFNDVYAQGTARYSKTLDTVKKNINPASVGLFHKIINSCFKTTKGKQFLKEHNCNIKDFYNIEVVAEPGKDHGLAFEFSNGKFYLGKSFFEAFNLNQEDFTKVTKSEYFLDYVLKILKDAVKYIKENRSNN